MKTTRTEGQAPIVQNPESRPTQAAGAPSPAGAGVLGDGPMSLPGIDGQAAATIAAEALASLSAFRASHAKLDVDALLVEVAVGMRSAEATNQQNRIVNDREAKLSQMREKEAKLGEAAEKLRAAEERKAGGDVLANVKLAFEWIGTIVAFATAAVLIATGAGAVVGGLLLAAAFTSLFMAIDSSVSHATDLGIAGNIAKDTGGTDEQIGQADMGFKISLAILGVGFSLAAGGVSAAGAAKAAVDAGTSAYQTARTAGEAVFKAVGKAAAQARDAFIAATGAAGDGIGQAARVAQRAVAATDAVTMLGSGGMEIGRSVLSYEETQFRAGAKELDSDAKSTEALMQSLDDMIDQALTRLMTVSERFNAILDEIMSAAADRSASLSRVRYAG